MHSLHGFDISSGEHHTARREVTKSMHIHIAQPVPLTESAKESFRGIWKHRIAQRNKYKQWFKDHEVVFNETNISNFQLTFSRICDIILM